MATRWAWARTGERQAMAAGTLCSWQQWAQTLSTMCSARRVRGSCIHRRYYDLEVLKREFGWIGGYVASKPGRYHEGVPPGELSQTGQVRAGRAEERERYAAC